MKGRGQTGPPQRSLARMAAPLAGSARTEAASCLVQLHSPAILDLTAGVQGLEVDKALALLLLSNSRMVRLRSRVPWASSGGLNHLKNTIFMHNVSDMLQIDICKGC